MSKLERQWLELTSEKCAVVEVSEQIGSKFRGGNGWALSLTWSYILKAIWWFVRDMKCN